MIKGEGEEKTKRRSVGVSSLTGPRNDRLRLKQKNKVKAFDRENRSKPLTSGTEMLEASKKRPDR